MKKLAVIALGGNALLRGNQSGTISEQESNTYETCSYLVELIKKKYNIVITHGNGPQVGNILLRNEAGYDNYKIPKMPLDICVADSQGGIGYMIQQQLTNVLNKLHIKKNILTLITEVVVDKNDPAFQNPTKPIGKYFLKEEAELLSRANNWEFREDPRKRGWRRVVPSPKPMQIMNTEIIKQLVSKGNIIVAVGGGGIPVMWKQPDFLEGIDAVIDKDLASARLAIDIGADEFYILTDIPKVCINFQKPNQKSLDKLTVRQARKYLKTGEFAAGSMGPKIEAGIQFTIATKRTTIITEASELSKPDAGTKIIYS
ncbi:MAG: carbamate kinase [Ignavibacteriaceae bacterium]|nr:carbamate kinase [Ignavibacteriaceae bacterium]